MPNEDSDLTLVTEEDARKALHDLWAKNADLTKENASTAKRMDLLAADLKAATKRLTEAEHRATSNLQGGEGEGDLKAFLKSDGTVRLRGESTDEDVWSDGLLDSEPVCRWQADLQDAVEQYTIVRAIRRGPYPGGPGDAPKALRRVQAIAARAPQSVKRIFTDSSGVGAEWVPDPMLAQLERTVTAERRVAALFQTMPMNSKNVILPFLTTGFRPYLKGQAASDDPAQYTSSSLTTAQRTFAAVGLAVRAQIDEDASEDSIIDSMGLIREELVRAIVDGEEDCIINGDTAGTHQDTISGWNIRSRWGASGLGGSDDHRRSWIGLRARATDVSNTTDRATFSFATFQADRGSLDSPLGLAGDLVCITSIEAMLVTISKISEVIKVNEYGPLATIRTGQLGDLGGVPIVLSDFVDKELNASGVYDDSTKTKTGAVLANTTRFKLMERRGTSVELAKDITRGIFNMVATKRELFATVDSSTAKNVHWAYNMATS